MQKKELFIEQKECEQILADGKRFSLLCQYEMKGVDDTEISIYYSEDDLQVIAVLDEEEKAQAIRNVFALDNESLVKTMQFIDSTVSKKKEFIVYETKTFPECVMKAVVMGAKFATLSKCEMYEKVEKLLHARKNEMNKKKCLSMYEEYMVPVVYKGEYVLSEEEFSELCVQKDDEDSKKQGYVVTLADSLPKGWRWMDDEKIGFGKLEKPDGNVYLSYEVFNNGIRFQKSQECSWTEYKGKLSTFKRVAEFIALEEMNGKNVSDERSLDEYFPDAETLEEDEKCSEKYEMSDEEFVVQEANIVPAKYLPKGWYWEEYVDGSGWLKRPDEEIYLTYVTDSLGMRFKKPLEQEWTNYEGDVSKFWKMAEFLALQSVNIDELDLTVRTYNRLKRGGVFTVADLCGKTEKEVMAIRNLGIGSFAEIQAKLEKMGLELRLEENCVE